MTHWGSSRRSTSGFGEPRPRPRWTCRLAPMRWDPIAIPDEPRLVPRRHSELLPRLVTPGTQAGMGCHVYLSPGRWRMNTSTTPTAKCSLSRSREPSHMDRVRHYRHRAWRDRGYSAWREDQGRAHRGPARGYLCENYGGSFTLPERGPSEPIVSPIRAISSRPSRPMRIRTWPSRMFVKWGGSLWATDDRALASRRGRMARQLRSLQIRPSAVFACRAHPFRPCGSLDFYCPDIAVRNSRYRQHRLRDLSRTVGWWRKILSGHPGTT